MHGDIGGNKAFERFLICYPFRHGARLFERKRLVQRWSLVRIEVVEPLHVSTQCQDKDVESLSAEPAIIAIGKQFTNALH